MEKNPTKDLAKDSGKSLINDRAKDLAKDPTKPIKDPKKDFSDLKLERVNYNSYLKIEELLSLQKELSDPPHHDEMFFIIIHQAAELWFKEILHETTALTKAFETNSVSRALKILRRLVGIMDLQVKQINLLATLTPVEFAGFRESLRPASGFQSLQFRLIEFAFGLRDDFFIQFFEKDPYAANLLKIWKDRPSVRDTFIQYVKNFAPKGTEVSSVESSSGSTSNSSPGSSQDPRVLAQIRDIYKDPGENYHWILLCEALLDFDEKFALWRTTHLLMVARTIGQKTGTGGSSGMTFLQKRLEHRFFPELWGVRNGIGSHY